MPIEQVAQVFEQIAAKNSFETKQILAQAFDRPIENHEKIEPQKDGTARYTTSFSLEMLAALETLKALNSNRNLSENIEDLLLPLVQKEIARIKVVPKTSKESTVINDAPKPNPKNNESAEFTESDELSLEVMLSNCGVRPARIAVSNRLWQFVMRRAQYQCEYVHLVNGKKCDETHHLEVDHKIPVALGGLNRLSNLRVLCRTHNQFVAKRRGLIKAEGKIRYQYQGSLEM